MIPSLSLLPGAAAGQRLEATTQPGTVALMRHTLAPGMGDRANFDIADCSTQRELDAQGRVQARRVGQALHDAGVVFDQVWASLWCRSYETAELMEWAPACPSRR